MNEHRPSQGTVLPSAQYSGTGRTLLSTTMTGDGLAGRNDQTFLLPETHGEEDGEAPVADDPSGSSPGIDQAGLAESSPSSRTVHGKVACQACVSRVIVCRSDA